EISPLRVTSGSATLLVTGKVPIEPSKSFDVRVSLVHPNPSRTLEAFDLPYRARDARLSAIVQGTLKSPAALGFIDVLGIRGPSRAGASRPRDTRTSSRRSSRRR